MHAAAVRLLLLLPRVEQVLHPAAEWPVRARGPVTVGVLLRRRRAAERGDGLVELPRLALRRAEQQPRLAGVRAPRGDSI